MNPALGMLRLQPQPLRVLAAGVCAAAVLVLAGPSVARADTAPFSYTGAPVDWTVPAGVHQATFDLTGAQGGTGYCLNWGVGGCGATPGGAGGLGARLQTVVALTPGEVLKIRVGGAGGNGFEATSSTSPNNGAGVAGFNGGGAGGGSFVDGFNPAGSGGGGGGGATDVRSSADTLAARLLVAAGGGGGGAGGRGSNSAGHPAACPGHTLQGEVGGPGGNSGSNGSAGSYGNATPGSKGTDSAGGTGGTASSPAGSGGNGGNGDISNGGAGGPASGVSVGGGGGGGGGLYAAGGGGGGAGASGTCVPGVVYNDVYPGAGGGGGASYAAAPIGTPTLTDGTRAGNGALTITYEVLPDATTGAASAISTDSASVAGTVNPNAKPATFHIEYGTTTSYGSSTTESSAGSGSTADPVSAALSGLAPATEYHYRVVATTCAGCLAGTDAGDDATFTTQALPIPAASPAETGERAAALAKCKKKKQKLDWSKKRYKKCKRQANQLPV